MDAYAEEFIFYARRGSPIHRNFIKICLSDIFQDRLIGKVFSIIWPLYSPDLTPIDFWL